VPDRWRGHRYPRQWARTPCQAIRAILRRPKSWWSCLLHPATRQQDQRGSSLRAEGWLRNVLSHLQTLAALTPTLNEPAGRQGMC
jgi:hypothetical protein